MKKKQTLNLLELSDRFCFRSTKALLVLNLYFLFFTSVLESLDSMCPTEILLIDKECK